MAIRAIETSATYLNPDLVHWRREQERPDLGDNGTLLTCHHDGVAHGQLAIDEDDVDGRTMAGNGLDLHDCCLELLCVHDPLEHHGLSEFADQGYQVAHSVSCGGGRRNERDELPRLRVFVEQSSIQALQKCRASGESFECRRRDGKFKNRANERLTCSAN